MKSKIDPSKVKEMTWKEYVKSFKADIKKAESSGIDKSPIVMVSDFTFACGEVHALMLLGKASVLKQFFQSLKTDSDRMKLKDFSKGFCYFEQEADGSTALNIAIKGFGKPARMKKNSRKLFQQLGVTLKDIIKGELLDEVVDDIEAEDNDVASQQTQELQHKADGMKAQDDTTNDLKSLSNIAKEFSKNNSAINTEVITLLKLSKNQPVIYIDKHINIAEKAFRAAASLVDKYAEVATKEKNLDKKASKIFQLKTDIEQKGLVQKYELIWKKVTQEYKTQLNKLSEPLKAKFDELSSLLDEIKKESVKNPS